MGIARREYTHGYYSVEGRHLYVNRGLSYGQRKLHWCRPEITVFPIDRRRKPPSNRMRTRLKRRSKPAIRSKRKSFKHSPRSGNFRT